MKFVMNERLKHRLTGLVVIVSIAIIFLPAMMKKSNQRFEENMNVSLKLPAKPMPPKVSIPNQQAMFQTVKVAHVDVPKIAQPRPSQIAKAESLSAKLTTTAVAVVSKPAGVAAKSAAIAAVVMKPTVPIVTKVAVVKKEKYAIQLASFAQQSNAQSLVTRLKSQGYAASYTKFTTKQGNFYKVVVGQINAREEALHLQKKLATNMQLNGFVVKAVG